MKRFDFLIIGAQKSGTTTLFQQLSEHSDVHVPPGKEVPFFTRDTVSAEDFQAFMAEHFGAVPQGRLIGKVTPHYLVDGRVPARIATFAPQAKLVAILRDPVDRALSHYRMSVRRELEQRSFDQAVADLLQPDELTRTRTLPAGQTSEHQTYVVWGEYGRLLAPYAAQLAAGQMLVLYMSDLETDPEATLRKLCAFLGVAFEQVPSLGKKMHQGGDRERLPIAKIAKSIGVVRRLWRLMPHRWRSRLLFRIGQWNVVASEASGAEMSPATRAALTAHFTEDGQRLCDLTGEAPPWLR